MRVKRLESGQGITEPKQAHVGDAGYDLRSTEDVKINPDCVFTCDCGFAFEIPAGYVGLIFPRSGLGTKFGLRLRNSVGVIDSTYRGPVKLCMENAGELPYFVRKGDAIAQMVVVPFYSSPVEVVDELNNTERGENGFGSTSRS